MQDLRDKLIVARGTIDAALSEVLVVWSNAIVEQEWSDFNRQIPPIWDLARDLSLASNSLNKAIFHTEKSEYLEFFEIEMDFEADKVNYAEGFEEPPIPRRKSKKK